MVARLDALLLIASISGRSFHFSPRYILHELLHIFFHKCYVMQLEIITAFNIVKKTSDGYDGPRYKLFDKKCNLLTSLEETIDLFSSQGFFFSVRTCQILTVIIKIMFYLPANM